MSTSIRDGRRDAARGEHVRMGKGREMSAATHSTDSNVPRPAPLAGGSSTDLDKCKCDKALSKQPSRIMGSAGQTRSRSECEVSTAKLVVGSKGLSTNYVTYREGGGPEGPLRTGYE
jgi:hypothetical protein